MWLRARLTKAQINILMPIFAVKGKAQVGVDIPIGSKFGCVGSGTGRALVSVTMGPALRNEYFDEMGQECFCKQAC